MKEITIKLCFSEHHAISLCGDETNPEMAAFKYMWLGILINNRIVAAEILSVQPIAEYTYRIEYRPLPQSIIL